MTSNHRSLVADDQTGTTTVPFSFVALTSPSAFDILPPKIAESIMLLFLSPFWCLLACRATRRLYLP